MATVVELISAMLKREGVQYLFGIPGGGGTIDLLDATEKQGIRFVLNSHETGPPPGARTKVSEIPFSLKTWLESGFPLPYTITITFSA